MWSKGAVVVVKYGDKEMANEIEAGITRGKHIKKDNSIELPLKSEEEIRKERKRKEIEKKIRDARLKYGYYEDKTPKILKFLQVTYGTIYCIYDNIRNLFSRR